MIVLSTQSDKNREFQQQLGIEWLVVGNPEVGQKRASGRFNIQLLNPKKWTPRRLIARLVLAGSTSGYARHPPRKSRKFANLANALLTVKVNCLRQWYRPGLVCIGDAAQPPKYSAHIR